MTSTLSDFPLPSRQPNPSNPQPQTITQTTPQDREEMETDLGPQTNNSETLSDGRSLQKQSMELQIHKLKLIIDGQASDYKKMKESSEKPVFNNNLTSILPCDASSGLKAKPRHRYRRYCRSSPNPRWNSQKSPSTHNKPPLFSHPKPEN